MQEPFLLHSGIVLRTRTVGGTSRQRRKKEQYSSLQLGIGSASWPGARCGFGRRRRQGGLRRLKQWIGRHRRWQAGVRARRGGRSYMVALARAEERNRRFSSRRLVVDNKRKESRLA